MEVSSGRFSHMTNTTKHNAMEMYRRRGDRVITPCNPEDNDCAGQEVVWAILADDQCMGNICHNGSAEHRLSQAITLYGARINNTNVELLVNWASVGCTYWFDVFTISFHWFSTQARTLTVLWQFSVRYAQEPTTNVTARAPWECNVLVDRSCEQQPPLYLCIYIASL